MSHMKSHFFIPFMVANTVLGVHAATKLAAGGLMIEWLAVAFTAGAMIGYISWVMLSSFLLGSGDTRAQSRVWPVVALTVANVGVAMYTLYFREGSLLALAYATTLFNGWMLYDFWYSVDEGAKLPVGEQLSQSRPSADYIGKFPL